MISDSVLSNLDKTEDFGSAGGRGRNASRKAVRKDTADKVMPIKFCLLHGKENNKIRYSWHPAVEATFTQPSQPLPWNQTLPQRYFGVAEVCFYMSKRMNGSMLLLPGFYLYKFNKYLSEHLLHAGSWAGGNMEGKMSRAELRLRKPTPCQQQSMPRMWKQPYASLN